MKCCIYCGETKESNLPWLKVRTTSNPKVTMDICPKCHTEFRQMLRTKEYKGQLEVLEGNL